MMMPELADGGMWEQAALVKELAANEYAHTDPLTTPVEECFNWTRELPGLVATSGGNLEYYLVMFRSIRKSSADSHILYRADAAAHDEARLSGGLLKVLMAIAVGSGGEGQYWYGTLNERRECLAMCIWATRDDAVKAIHKPAHRKAMQLAPAMYDMYTLERYSLKIDANLCPSFTLLGSMSS